MCIPKTLPDQTLHMFSGSHARDAGDLGPKGIMFEITSKRGC